MQGTSPAAAARSSKEPGAALFRLMAEQWPGAVLVLDRQLRVCWANAAAGELTGGRALAGMPAWQELGLPWRIGARRLADVLDGRTERLDPVAIRGPDGRDRTWAGRLVPLREVPQLVSAILCVLEEDPQSIEARADTASDTQRQHALTSAQVGSWHWDFAAGFFTVDSHWCHALGIDPCPGPDHIEKWIRLLHPDDAGEFRRRLAAVEVGQSERFEAEYRIFTTDSHWLWILQRGRIVEYGGDGRARRVTGICIEIDDRKRLEVALRENEARLATALWGARAAFWHWHIGREHVFLSPMWYAMTGYSREQWESVPNPLISRVHPDDRERVRRHIEDNLRGASQSIECEFRVLTAQGAWRWMMMRGRVVEWDFEGNPTSAIGVALDIDRQKNAELELRSSEARLETAVWGAGMGLWELDFRSGLTRWFSDWCDRLDLDPCEGADHVDRWDANVHPEDLPEAARRFSDHLAGKEDYYDAEYRVRDRKGRWRWLFERGRVVERDADGKALRMVGICMDIDARKAAELETVKSRLRLEAALESARGGMWDWDLAGGCVRYTEYYQRLTGVQPEDRAEGVPGWLGRVHPEDRPHVRESLERAVDGRADLYEAEYRLRHADGTWRWILDRGRATERDENGRATRMVGFAVDVTDRVQTQEALQRNEFRYRTVASLTPGYVFEIHIDPSGRLGMAWISEGFQAVFGCTFEEMNRHDGGWKSFIAPEFREDVEERLRRVLAGERQCGEFRVRTVDGASKWLHSSMVPLRDPRTGAVIGVIGSAHDITQRKLAEQALRESEAVLRAVTENTPDWLFLLDEQLNVRFLNHAFRGSRVEEIVGRCVLDFIPAVHRATLAELYRGVFATARPARFDLRHPQPDGTCSHYEYRVVPVAESGLVRAITVAVTDVTERRRAEIALRESQSMLQTVADSSADWLALFDRNLRCVFVNRSLRGLTPAAWVGRPIEELAGGEERERIREVFAHVLATGEPRDFEQVIPGAPGGPQLLEVRARAVRSDERIVGVVVNITDVTERHAQQNTLRTQARILETMREGVVLVDRENRIRLTNPTFDAMLGYGPGELLGESVEPFMGMSPARRRRYMLSVREAAERGEVLTAEFECVRRDGSRFVASCAVTPLTVAGEPRWLAVLNDVTERKRLEREIIEIANREQQRIGSDLHDGLGQDLTGIALMLRGVVAQLRKEGSAARHDVEDVIGLVNGAIESTRALARGLTPVSAERGGLAAALRSLAERAGERYGLKVSFEAQLPQPLELEEAAATHLYRIAQEALTNVIRHSRASEVWISLEANGEELVLRVEDNGRGFAQSGEGANGLGLKIMRYRAQMLGGDVVLEKSAAGGAAVRCTCPLGAAP